MEHVLTCKSRHICGGSSHIESYYRSSVLLVEGGPGKGNDSARRTTQYCFEATERRHWGETAVTLHERDAHTLTMKVMVTIFHRETTTAIWKTNKVVNEDRE